jgi:putative transferase (TIGR04331 family)
MVLLTTSYKPSWVIDENSEILFANEWCKLYSDEKNWKNTNHKTFPYHWKDRNKLYADLQKLDIIYEDYLSKLTIKLNDLHNTDYSEKYWRIVIGPWLNDFIVLVYNYYATIKNIDKSKLVTSTYIIETKWENHVCQDITAFQESYSKPWYSHFLFGEIIKLSSKIPIKYLDTKHPYIVKVSATTGKKTFKESLKRLLKYILSFLYSSFLVPNKFKKIVFVSSYFSKEDLTGIQTSLKQLPFDFLFDPKAPIKQVNKKIRREIVFKDSKDSFANILNQLLPKQIPVAYIENYNLYNKISNLFFPKNPKVIFTSNSYYFNEAFKIWSAKKTENKTKLLISQHGISGVSLRDPTEDHQIMISDKFYTWGWSDGTVKTKKMPSNKLNYTKKIITHDPLGDVVCVVMSDILNYLNKQVPIPSEDGYKRYIDDLISINQYVDQKISINFKYRLYHTNFNREVLGAKYKFISSGLKDSIDDDDQNFYERISKCRLVIISYRPGTTATEVLSANIPSLHFCPIDCGELNQNAKKSYEVLKEAGIFHDNIKSLSGKINEVYYHVDQWWYSKKVQNAVSIFCKNYAYTDDNFMNKWVNELDSQINIKGQ